MITGNGTIRTRRDLFEYLGECMAASVVQPLEGGSFHTTTNPIKTLLLEHDWTEEPTNPLDYFRTLFSFRRRHQKEPPLPPPDVHLTGEDGFYWIKLQPRHRGRDVELWLDTTSDESRRFWIAYSLSDATLLDLAIDRLVMQQANLDRIWLWPSFLERLQQRGRFRGIGLDYDYRPFERTRGVPAPDDYFKLRLHGGEDTSDIYDYIKRHPKFHDKVVIASIRMAYSEDSGASPPATLENVRYSGRFTTRGWDFQAHQRLVVDVRDEYATTIRRIEDLHRPGPKQQQLAGSPIRFDLRHHPIDDVDAFCETVYSGSNPFRIWGTVSVHPFEAEARRVLAVDMHTGSKLYFEVFSDSIMMQLYSQSCGNTVARFYTHLQHFFARRVEVSISDGESGTL